MPLTASDVLSMNGPVAVRLGGGFEAREQQLRMADAVAATFESKSHLLVEAGTGVGKSFAYLVPAMLRAVERNETVVIATHTIALQEQLIEKDIPLLESILYPAPADETQPRPLRAVLVKGRGNYLSTRRLRMASERGERTLPDAASRRSLAVIQDWAYETTDGTLSTLPTLERPGVWDRVQSDSGNCMGKRCSTYQQCFYQKARAQLEGANLLICNHALFFSDLALRAEDAGFLPKYHHVVLDEAHGVEDVASDHFGVALSEGRVNHLLNTLYSPRVGRGYLSQLAVMLGDSAPVEAAIRLVDQAATASRAFFESVAEHVRGAGQGPQSPFGRGGDSGTIRFRSAGAVSNALTPAIRELGLRLRAMREMVKGEADTFELNAYALRAEQIAQDADLLVTQGMPGAVYWGETSGGDDDFGGARLRVNLSCSPIEVGPLLRERLFRQDHSVVLTSATLTTRTVVGSETKEGAETAFAHVISRLGCEGASTLQLGSPFDHARQVRVFVHTDAATAASRGTALSPLSVGILKHVEETEGGAFVLFTSFASLNRCASELAGPLAERGLPLLAQGRDGSRSHILGRFRQDRRSVLFGAASFWQGVDVKGEGLRNVIITKLPFDPPDRPLTQARNELIEARGGNAFMEDSIPRAVMKFKQGFGRLIRGREDRGRVVVLDSRVLTARYGRLFIKALPQGMEIEVID